MFGWGARRAFERRQHYYHLVTAVLSQEFEWDEHTEELLLQSLTNQDGPSGAFEFILDHNPVVAAFRLKWGNEGLRVAYYPSIPPGNPEREARAQRLTTELRKLSE